MGVSEAEILYLTSTLNTDSENVYKVGKKMARFRNSAQEITYNVNMGSESKSLDSNHAMTTRL